MWNANDGTHIRTLEGHTGLVLSVAFSPDGQTLASGGDLFPFWGDINDTLRLWNANDGTHIRTLEGHTGPSIWSVAFSPDGQTIASGGTDKTIRLWNANDGTHIRTLEGHTDDVRSVAFSPDGKALTSGSDDETVRMWDVRE